MLGESKHLCEFGPHAKFYTFILTFILIILSIGLAMYEKYFDFNICQYGLPINLPPKSKAEGFVKQIGPL